ncbi:MAG: DUF4250 domain-containing protein [Verrucomicrobiota bacterium]
MNLQTAATMDPQLLLGLINTALRNDAEDLRDLLAQHDLDRQLIEERLGSLGYAYDPEIRQFRHESSGNS